LIPKIESRGEAAMRFKVFSLSIAIFTALAGPAITQTFQSGPMKFRRSFFATADRGNIEWIVADGEITADTPKDFRRFLLTGGTQRGARLEVYLNSPGGNLIGAIQFGEAIREFGLGTRVARTVPDGPAFRDGEQPETDAPGYCYSACAFVFLAGKWRIADGRSLGVHQSYFKEALAEPNAPKFTARDFSAQQLIEGLVLEYVVRMGVDPRFITYVASTAPTDLYVFTADEMSRFGITWNDLEYLDWTLEPRGDGLVAVSKTRNGDNSTTLFCRKDRIVRLSIDSRNPFTADVSIDWIIKQWKNASLFYADIPLQNISARLSRGRLIMEVLLPPSLRTSDNNWLPDGKTVAWYLQKIQGIGNSLSYDPSSTEWKALTQRDKEVRRELFEREYKRLFRSLPTYAADGSPIVPPGLEIPRDLGGLSIWAGPGSGGVFDHDLPAKNFLTYSKLIGRNCI
jgi:hypothetical protein